MVALGEVWPEITNGKTSADSDLGTSCNLQHEGCCTYKVDAVS